MGCSGTKFTFKLRQGVKWHDGKPFTAKDVQCTWYWLTGKNGGYFRKDLAARDPHTVGGRWETNMLLLSSLDASSLRPSVHNGCNVRSCACTQP